MPMIPKVIFKGPQCFTAIYNEFTLTKKKGCMSDTQAVIIIWVLITYITQIKPMYVGTYIYVDTGY